MQEKQPLDSLIACKQCDGLFTLPKLKEGQKARCCHCGGTLTVFKRNSVERSMALSVAGLVFFVPAVSLPIFGISAAGNANEASLIESIVLAINNGDYIVATALFLFTIAIPLVRLIMSLVIHLSLRAQKNTAKLRTFFRSYQNLDSWAMVHVLLLGVIISMYKLGESSELQIGTGLVSLCLLLFCSTMLSITMDHQHIWQQLDECPNG